MKTRLCLQCTQSVNSYQNDANITISHVICGFVCDFFFPFPFVFMHFSSSTCLCFSLQDSETLLSLSRSEGGAISLSLGLKTKRLPSSPCLLVHFHGGGFVAQTSKSHEVK